MLSSGKSDTAEVSRRRTKEKTLFGIGTAKLAKRSKA